MLYGKGTWLKVYVILAREFLWWQAGLRVVARGAECKWGYCMDVPEMSERGFLNGCIMYILPRNPYILPQKS